MLVREYELSDKLQTGLPALVWVSGEETLLVSEACENILQQAKDNGFTERDLVYLDAKPKWDNLFAASMGMSLFGDKKVIDVRLNTLKLGREGGTKIAEWLSMLDENVLVLIRSGKVGPAEKKLKWFKLLDQAGWVVQVWPIDIEKLPRWIMTRAQNQGLQFEPAAAEALAVKVEGNLLAAKQEIEKIALLDNANKPITVDTIYHAVSDSAHYDVFKLVDSMLGSNISKTLKIFRSLLAEGVALQIILWAITKDVRELSAMESSGKSFGSHKPLEYMPPSIWQKRLPLLMQAVQRKRKQSFSAMFHELLEIDKASKGWGVDSVEKTEQLLIRIAGM